DPDKIKWASEDIINTILRSGGRGLHTPAPGITGRLQERTLPIPDHMVAPYVVNDVQRVMRTAARTMGTGIELTRKFGSIDLRDQLKEIVDDYTKLRDAVPDGPKKEARLLALDRAMRRDTNMIEGVRDRLRGTYAIPQDAEGLAHRATVLAK